MNVLILGNRGQLGLELTRLFSALHLVYGVDRNELDICDQSAVLKLLDKFSPDVIINAAAYTAVDLAEQEQDRCFAVNYQAPVFIAEQALERGLGLIHFSTDYVFDGELNRPYKETDKANPLSVYGLSKLQADDAILQLESAAWIFRTSWVYAAHGKNFYLTMKKLLREKDSVNVIDDQIGVPTSVTVITDLISAIIKSCDCRNVNYMYETRGLYHMTCKGQASWYSFAKAIAEELQQAGEQVASVNAIATKDYPCAARRPAYSVLDTSYLQQTFGIQVPDWRQGLSQVHRYASQTLA